mmetsp:Transcript_22792/g.49968  ORF Transcript_22792/g.49968 Transcript_22792/m.49968 type:complete len:217 (+) Transcript_22792:1891-2541(+)
MSTESTAGNWYSRSTTVGAGTEYPLTRSSRSTGTFVRTRLRSLRSTRLRPFFVTLQDAASSSSLCTRSSSTPTSNSNAQARLCASVFNFPGELVSELLGFLRTDNDGRISSAHPSPFLSNTHTTSPSSSSVYSCNESLEGSVGEEDDVGADKEEVSRRTAKEGACNAHCPGRIARKPRIVPRPLRNDATAGPYAGRPALNIIGAYAASRVRLTLRT